MAQAAVASEAAPENVASLLPKPAGYRLLIALPEVEETTQGGVIKADTTRELERVSSVIGYVMEMGPDTYADVEKFPSGAWCKKGDFIAMQAYVGVRIKVHGKEFRIINDDQVMAVVEDPRGIERA